MAAYWLTGLGLTLSFAALQGQDWRGSVQLHIGRYEQEFLCRGDYARTRERRSQLDGIARP